MTGRYDAAVASARKARGAGKAAARDAAWVEPKRPGGRASSTEPEAAARTGGRIRKHARAA
jgi:hypothetical protein